MYPMFLLALSHLKSKKMQAAVIAAIILLSALLMTTALALTGNAGGYFRDVHRAANGSHTLLQFENGCTIPKPCTPGGRRGKGSRPPSCSGISPSRNSSTRAARSRT